MECFPETVDIYPVQLPGRGTRLDERPIHHFPTLIKAIVKEITPCLDIPFAFFGHSLGGLVAFEISRQLCEQHLPLPLHLFISGCASPTGQNSRRVLSTLPEHALIDELRRLNGTPEEILQNRELMVIMLPIIRADFSLFESYHYRFHLPLLECPVTVFGGSEDPDIALEQLITWKDETHGTFALYLLSGDHFFLHSAEAELLALIARQLHPFIRKVA